MKAKTRANLLVALGAVCLTAAGALVHVAAGFAVAGAALVLSGLFVVDVADGGGGR